MYVSAKNSANCVTLSGRGDQLAQFVEEKLPSQCRTRPTNVLTLYHNRARLNNIFLDTLNALEREISSQWEVPVVLAAPLFSTVTGAPLPISHKPDTPTTLGQLVRLLLEMILLEPVDWVAVQDSVLTAVQQHGASAPCEILNFGPGYGVSKAGRSLPKTVEIRDVSATGASSTPSNGASAISLDDIAIVGMAVDLPGAQDADELWENLCNGVNSCSEVSGLAIEILDAPLTKNLVLKHPALPDPIVKISHRRLLPEEGRQGQPGKAVDQHAVRQLPEEPVPLRQRPLRHLAPRGQVHRPAAARAAPDGVPRPRGRRVRAGLDPFLRPGRVRVLRRQRDARLYREPSRGHRCVLQPGHAPRFPERPDLLLFWLERPVYYAGHCLLVVNGCASSGGAVLGRRGLSSSIGRRSQRNY